MSNTISTHLALCTLVNMQLCQKQSVHEINVSEKVTLCSLFGHFTISSYSNQKPPSPHKHFFPLDLRNSHWVLGKYENHIPVSVYGKGQKQILVAAWPC